MYCGAQRVRSAARAGINGFLFWHLGSFLPLTATGHPDLELVSKFHPGTLVQLQSDIPPGGNEVLSFLDVAAPDSVPGSIIAEHLRSVEAEVPGWKMPATWRSPDIELSLFFSARNLDGSLARREFKALCDRLIPLLTGDYSMAAAEPFEAILRRVPEGFQLEWTGASKQRLREVGFLPITLTFSSDVAHDWAAQGPPDPLLAHSVAAMAGADLYQLVRLGGVVVLSEESRKIVWQRRPPQ